MTHTFPDGSHEIVVTAMDGSVVRIKPFLTFMDHDSSDKSGYLGFRSYGPNRKSPEEFYFSGCMRKNDDNSWRVYGDFGSQYETAEDAERFARLIPALYQAELRIQALS